MFHKTILKCLAFFCLFIQMGCKTKTTLFNALDVAETHIVFENKLTETEALNILSYEYFYNGGGMAGGDFNNDGLIDLYFSGNQVANKLFINNGDLKFTETNANIAGKPNSWKTGVAVADVNNDGWLDIYLSYSGIGSNESRKNQLFINGGLKNGKWSSNFTEEAQKYGIADAGYTTHASFFDFDIDGDLDLFVLNHNLKNYQRKEASQMKSAIDSLAGDRLYRNDNNKFVDIKQKAGIISNPLGFGLGLSIADFNQDNLPDIYVANDYVEEDYLYINQGKGIFKESGKQAMGHFSYSTMGVDAADVNNDGLTDIFTADMLPEDNKRQKLLAFPDNWNVQKSMLDNSFHWQNMRNMLQINQGNNKTTPVFAEIGQFAGVSATDWSWAPLLADFDNDGLKDLFVSNGFVKDLTDLDFVKYYIDEETKKSQNQPAASLLELVKKMPSTPTHHYIFKNNGNNTFDNKVTEWGFDKQTIGCGAIYADLDNDGDLEIITNNTNEPAKIYKNNLQESTQTNYIKLKLTGKNSTGAKANVYADSIVQSFQNYATHGFQSSFIDNINVGLGKASEVDSIIVTWANGKKQVVMSPKINSIITLAYSENLNSDSSQKQFETYFTETEVIKHSYLENEFIDFNRQILLPKMYSKVGPKFTKGDVNSDGLEDLFVSSAVGQLPELYLQKSGNKFVKSYSFSSLLSNKKEIMDAVFIDVDSDKDLDLYILYGGYEQILEDPVLFQDELLLNDGKGNFLNSKNQIPQILTNKSVIKIIDYDNDNDNDLIIGGAVRTGLYPYSDSSILLNNNGKGMFTISGKFETGLVTDIVVADIDNDKYSDVVVVGEFSTINLIKNIKGKFNFKPKPLVEKTHGWYSKIVSDDIDNDGDVDFIVGNLGLNSPLKASLEKPLKLFYGDTDASMSIEIFLANYYGDKLFPIAGRDEALEQLPNLRKKFIDYKSYSVASIDQLFDNETFKNMNSLTINQLQSGILKNNKGKFTFEPLPLIAQYSTINSILVNDINKDGIKDLILAGNNSNFRLRIGKIDANFGLLLLGQKDGSYKAVGQAKSGFFLNGDIKDIVKINNCLIFGVNNNLIKSFKINTFDNRNSPSNFTF
jgi:enediyne biosynthesis protein E4